MEIAWAKFVRLIDKDRDRELDLTLAEAVDEASTFDPARLAITEIHCDPPIQTRSGPRNILNADNIAQLIQHRKTDQDPE